MEWSQIFSALILVVKNPKTAKGALIAAVCAIRHRWLKCVFCRDTVDCVCVCVCVTLLNCLRDSESGWVEGCSFLWIADSSSAAVNCACFVLNDERPFRLTALA